MQSYAIKPTAPPILSAALWLKEALELGSPAQRKAVVKILVAEIRVNGAEAVLSIARGRCSHCGNVGGSEGIRTPDLVSAIHALSQLSYGPTHGWAEGPV